jgi:hypothetical protein
MTDQYFTLVFRGSIGDFKEPLKMETPFGIPVAACVGDALAETDRIEQLEAALREIVDFPNIGEQAAQQIALIASAALAPEQDK